MLSTNAIASPDIDTAEEIQMIDAPPNPEIDNTDTPSSETSFSIRGIFSDIISIVLHIGDVSVDIVLARRYWLEGQHLYFYWTIAILVTSSLLSVMVSEEMYYNQERKLNAGSASKKRFIRKPLWQKACYIFILAFQLTPLLRTMDVLSYAIKSYRCKQQGDKTNQIRYYTKMQKEKEDLAVLKVVECVLEAIPQQILQLTILLKEHSSTSNSTYVLQVISVCGPLVGMTLTMASYNYTAHKWSIFDKSNICEVLLTFLLCFLWYFCMPVTKIMTISGTATLWAGYTGIYCAIRWLSMTIWILVYGSKVIELGRERRPIYHLPLALSERIRFAIFAPVIAVVYVFVYVNPYVGERYKLRRYMASYYVFGCVEDLMAAISWIAYDHRPTCKGIFCDTFAYVRYSFGLLSDLGCFISLFHYE